LVDPEVTVSNTDGLILLLLIISRRDATVGWFSILTIEEFCLTVSVVFANVVPMQAVPVPFWKQCFLSCSLPSVLDDPCRHAFRIYS
jgi:hypothetical protein